MLGARATIRKIKRSITTRGAIGTIRSGFTWVRDRISGKAARREAFAKVRTKCDLNFDHRFGVDTAGEIPAAHLDVESKNWIYGGTYMPVNADHFIQLFNELDLPYEDFTFVDLGSGKGRAVLLASAYPFKKIIGVEYSEALHRIAQCNLSRYPANARECQHVELLCMDAIEYQFPDTPLVVFLYNPFAGPAMAQAVENLRISFHQHPRRILVIYFEPRDSEAWDTAGFLTKIRSQPAVYETQTHASFCT